MTHISARAYAKINLTLDVVGKRPDGYHDLCMLMQTVGLFDEITIETNTGTKDQIESNLPYLPSDKRNIALLAAIRFFELSDINPGGIRIRLEKNIPVCAGLGGGSADAATVLRVLDSAYKGLVSEDKLMLCARELGSDVPYCMRGGTMLAEGRGERLTPVTEIVKCHVVLCKPNFSLSTGKVFSQLDLNNIKRRPDTQGALNSLNNSDLKALSKAMYNVLEEVSVKNYPEIGRIKSAMLDLGALGSMMSGSGPTVFGLFDNQKDAFSAYNKLKRNYEATFITETINPLKDL